MGGGEFLRYATNKKISSFEFIDLLKRSTLAERRPIDDEERMKAMLEHADILVTAWDGDKLIGLARSVSDFVHCCYLSDLAVDVDYQKRGIGKALIELTCSKLGDKATLILLAAPKAREYYPRIGFDAHPSSWILKKDKSWDLSSGHVETS